MTEKPKKKLLLPTYDAQFNVTELSRAHHFIASYIYHKVASSRPVYYSIFEYFWGATNRA